MGAQHFKQLTVWQEAKRLVLTVYELTGNFPKEEQYVLTAQMRRAAISVTSNIAEGFGRKTSKDKEHFYVMANGSLAELENQVLLAESLGYFNESHVLKAQKQLSGTGQLLNGLLRAHRRS